MNRGTYRDGVRLAIGIALLSGCLAPALPICAQVVYSESYPDNYPPPLPARNGPQPPPIVLEWEREVPIGGPLTTGPLGLVDGEVVVASSDGVVRVEIGNEGKTRREIGGVPPPDPEPFAWVVAGDGRHRARALPEGGLLVESRRKDTSRWKESWRRSLASPLSSPPILVDRRLIYATADGTVYAVRLSNGHRLWATDLGERLSRPGGIWSASLPSAAGDRAGEPAIVSLFLIVPDSGVALLAVDIYDGRVVARGEVPEGKGRLVSPPLLFQDGTIAVARQGYAREDAGLGFFRVRVSSKEATPDAPVPVPYNAAELPADSPTRR